MRTAPTTSPLILALRSTLIALEPATGAHLWQAVFAMQIRRVFPIEGALLVVLAEPGVRGQVQAIELASGMSRGAVQLDFDPSGAALVKDGLLFLASERGVACVTTGCQLVWHGGVVEMYRGIFAHADPTLVITGADGSERTQLRVGQESASGNAGLVLGELVSQPDLRD